MCVCVCVTACVRVCVCCLVLPLSSSSGEDSPITQVHMDTTVFNCNTCINVNDEQVKLAVCFRHQEEAKQRFSLIRSDTRLPPMAQVRVPHVHCPYTTVIQNIMTAELNNTDDVVPMALSMGEIIKQ